MFSNLLKIEKQSQRYKGAADDKHLLETDLDIINYEAKHGIERLKSLTTSIELFAIEEKGKYENTEVTFHFVTSRQAFVNYIISRYGLNEKQQLGINTQIVDLSNGAYSWFCGCHYKVSWVEVNKEFVI